MRREAVSGIMLTLLLLGMLSLCFRGRLVSSLVVTPSEYTLGYYEAIESVPVGSVAIMSFDLGPVVWAELDKICVATMQHLFWRIHEAGIRVVFLCFWATGSALLEDTLASVDKMGAVYGEDYVNLGYIPGGEVGMSAFADDIWGVKPVDAYGTLLSDLPMMANIHGIYDVYILATMEAGTPGLYEYIRQWWTRNNDLKIIVGCTLVMKPGIIPYYSWIVDGVLAGFEGCVEYEWLLVINYGYEPTVFPAIAGVEAGVWVKYGNITASWNSNDPEANPPDSINVEWMNNTVQTVYRNNVTFQSITHYKNDTQTTDTECIQLYTGEGNGTFWFVSAGLIPSESIYASPEWTDWKINETVSRTYAGVTRDTNHLTMTQSQFIPSDPPQNVTVSVEYYWNKVTGVLTEYQESFLNQTGSHETSWSLSYDIVDTNLWTTINVPADYSTIQEAIDAAKPGDSIHVGEGIYPEHVTTPKSLVLVGENSTTTIIDGSGDGVVITISAQNVEINGFTVQNGGHGIMARGYFRGNIIQGSIICNNTRSGIFIWYGNNNIIKDNIIASNGLPEEWGYGIQLQESHNNFVYNNTIMNNWYGIRLISSSANTLSHNNMTDNHFNFGVNIWSNSLAHFIHSIDTSNTVNGKPIHYLINQHNITIDPVTFPSVGYLGIVNSTNIVVRNLNTSKVGEGVLFAWTNNSTIENIQTSNDHYGLALVFSNSNVISENAVEPIYHTGIRTFSSNNNTMTDNRISNSGYGIVANDMKNSTISRNIISNSSYGLSVNAFDNGTISNNTVSNSDMGIRLFWSSGNRIEGNTVTNTSSFGIIVDSSDYNNIVDNNFINNTYRVLSYEFISDWYDEYFAGVYLNFANHCNVSNNTMTNSLAGTSLRYSLNNDISGNNITNNGIGLLLYDESYNNTASRNNMTNNGVGIDNGYSSQNTMCYNNIGNNLIGILLEFSMGNTIVKNVILDNDAGIVLGESSMNNTISGNNITKNWRGIWLGGSNNVISGNNITNNGCGIHNPPLMGISNNIIYHNNFVDNTRQVDTILRANWDNGYPSGGNYWSDYNGTDVFSGPYQNETGSDGIGDIPYTIDDDNRDNYPLMYPWGSPPPPRTLSIYSVPTGVTFTVDGISYTTPWSGTFSLSTSVNLVMPETHDGYIWSHWLEDGDTNRTKTVTMDTDFRLTGVFFHFADLNHDGAVGMQDIYVVIQAFGSNPTHPRWNPITDINEDNRVDMKDMYLVITNFGKTI